MSSFRYAILTKPRSCPNIYANSEDRTIKVRSSFLRIFSYEKEQKAKRKNGEKAERRGVKQEDAEGSGEESRRNGQKSDKKVKKSEKRC